MKIKNFNSELWKKYNALAILDTSHVMSLLYVYKNIKIILTYLELSEMEILS